MQKRRLLAVAIVVLSGCSDNRSPQRFVPPTSPTPVSHPTSVSQTWAVRGLVFQTNYQVCRDCVVEVVDGAGTGTSTRTDSRGQFSIDVPRESPQVTVRATKEGYRSVGEQVATQGSSHSAWVSLHVASVLPPAPLGGAYRMTLEADPIACTNLPPVARAREYDIVFNSNARQPAFWFQAEPVGAALERFDMYAGVSGNDIGVSIWHADDESAGIIERLNAESGESFTVLAWTPEPTGYAVPFTVPLKGTLSWCSTQAGASCVVCESSGHRLALVRR